MAAAGDRVDRFTLVRQLGSGGMGETWEAVRQSGDFEQRVAIKLADTDLLDSSDGIEAFRREATLAASLRHPNIAAVLDVDERGGYIVCELVDGADLRTVMRAVPGGKLDVPVVVHVVVQIARGLAHAHRRILRGKLSPVIHRDMSPSNVVIDYDGNVKIVDFGIARAMLNSGEVAESVKGKLSYMAPEQAMGARMDGRVDQYALGVIAYEALCGVRPNDGAHEGETLSCILGGNHVPLGERAPRVPAELAAVFERMLARKPEDRFPSMDAVLDALSDFAPPLTVHRALIPLVIGARQPHTIMRENGRFVSRPVPVEPLLRHVGAVAWPKSPPRPAEGSGRVPVVPCGDLGDGRAAAATEAAAAGGMASALPLVAPRKRVDSGMRRRDAPSARASGRAHVPARGPIARVLDSPAFWRGLTVVGAVLLGLVAFVAYSPDVLYAVLPRPAVGAQHSSHALAARGLGSESAARVAPANESGTAARDAADPTARRSALAGDAPVSKLGGSTSAVDRKASISASPVELPLEAASQRAADAQRPAAPRARHRVASAPIRAQTGPIDSDRSERARDRPASDVHARQAPPSRTDAAQAEGAARSDSAALSADADAKAPHASGDKRSPGTVRVKVFPWGKIWVDGRAAGAAPPIVELSLPAGQHVVAVGRQRPIRTQTVDVAPGGSSTLAFDLDGE